MPQIKPKLSSKRPSLNPLDEEKLLSFIQEAEEKPIAKTQEEAPQTKPQEIVKAEKVKKQVAKQTLPWEDEAMSQDSEKTFLLRLPEAYLLKLKYIRQKTGRSMNHFCLDILLSAIDEEVNRIKK